MLRVIALHILIAALAVAIGYGISLAQLLFRSGRLRRVIATANAIIQFEKRKPLQEFAAMIARLALHGAALLRSAAAIRSFRLLLLAAALLATSSTAQAHFLWTVLATNDEGQAEAFLWFSEGARPGEAFLLERLSEADAQLVLADGSSQELKWTRQQQGDEGGLMAATQAGAGAQLQASWQYGLFSRGDDPRLLMYYARYQQGLASPPPSAQSEQLALLVEVVKKDDKPALRVTWKGKPLAGSEVVIEWPSGNMEEATTDDQGLAPLDASEQGLYSIRAKHEESRSGELDGKAYASVLYYSTLALRIPEQSPSK